MKDALVLIMSHSGGTSSSLAVSYLLHSITSSVFVVAGEWDTQIGRCLRNYAKGFMTSHVFVTYAGLRPAEPCSISLVAMHQTLTELLRYLMQVPFALTSSSP
jgi:hypothetical protein